MWTTLEWLILGLGLLQATASATARKPPGIDAIALNVSSVEASYKRDVFYVGGRYVFDPVFNGSFLFDQMYVEKLTPIGGTREKYPLVFFHGGTLNGGTFLNTPDNRKGFASLFLDRGFQVYLVDQTSVGRSSSSDPKGFPLRVAVTAEIAEKSFTAPELFGGYQQAVLHTQFPGTGRKGDPSFDAFLAGLIPQTTNLVRQQTSMQASGCALLRKIGKAFFVSHSTGATWPALISDACPELVVGHVALEPDNSPFRSYSFNSTDPTRLWGLADIPLTYDPPVTNSSQINKQTVGTDTWGLKACILQAEPARQLPQIKKVPVLVITGEASNHITYDHCTVKFMRQAGVKVEWIKLSELGIKGNGHFGYLEKNNKEIFEVARKWICDHGSDSS